MSLLRAGDVSDRQRRSVDRCMYCICGAVGGFSNSEYWEQYAGGNADEPLNVSVRYRADLMNIVPRLARMKHGSVVHDIITPPG